MEAQEIGTRAAQIDHSGLGRVQLQLQPSQELLDQIVSLLRRSATTAGHDEIVTVAVELTNTPMTVLPPPIQRVHIDAG
jgi:hypothetical protein